MIDADLAAIYGVATRTLNQAVKRNAMRFPADFVFRVSAGEKQRVITNCDHLARLRFSKSLPWAYTEHGAIMAAMVLNSIAAVTMSVYVVRAFMRMREEPDEEQRNDAAGLTRSRERCDMEESSRIHSLALAATRRVLFPRSRR